MTIDLDRLAAAHAAATPGEWSVDGPPHNQIVWSSPDDRVCFMAHSDGKDTPRDIATAHFIALAHNELPALIAELRQLRAVKPIVEAIASWERENGTVAAIMPDEYETFCKAIARAAITGSARATITTNEIDQLRAERDALREALEEAVDVFDGMCDDEINEELLPRLRAALGGEYVG